MQLTFATGNDGKFAEARAALSPLGIQLYQFRDGYTEVQADTLDEVARAGAEQLTTRIEGPFFLEDAGLFVDALGGFPGVYSAYVHATIGCDGVLRLLHGVSEREARFEAVIAHHDGATTHLVSGVCHGTIADGLRGEKGFGFDPIFVPQGSTRTFAELPPDEKNALSHRGHALRALVARLSRA